MSHWSDAYMGREYLPKQFECGHFASCVLKEVFKRDIDLPSGHEEGSFGRARFLAAKRADFAEKVSLEEAQEGYGVLINTRGLDQHIGILCWIMNEWWVLHNAELGCSPNGAKGQVIRQRLRQMPARGYKIEGIYRWI